MEWGLGSAPVDPPASIDLVAGDIVNLARVLT